MTGLASNFLFAIKSTGNKSKCRQMELHQTKILPSKGENQQSEETVHGRGETFANHASDKQLVVKTHKGFK